MLSVLRVLGRYPSHGEPSWPGEKRIDFIPSTIGSLWWILSERGISNNILLHVPKAVTTFRESNIVYYYYLLYTVHIQVSLLS